MNKEDWKKLPEELQDFIWNDVTDINDKMRNKYNLGSEQEFFLNSLEDKVFLKIISPLDIMAELQEMPDAKDYKIREIALDIALKILAPIREYIEDVDRLILRLGAKVPPLKKLKKTSNNTENTFVDFAEGNLKELLEKYKNLGEERVSKNKIIDKFGTKVSPNINNWIKDYIHFLGAGNHSSLDRAKYLSKAKNILDLSPEDRKNVSMLVTAHDDGKDYKFTKSDSLLKISEIKKIEKKKNEPDKKKNIDDFLRELKVNIKKLEEKIISEKYLLEEVDNDINKLSNLLWDSIGLEDKEKAISCLHLMIKKKFFDNTIKNDKRLKGIFKRFLDLRYGKKTDNFLENNHDKLLYRRLFLEMILVDKLNFKEQEACTVAFYLSGIVKGSGQIVYLDKTNLSLKWREVQLVGNNITWLDDVK